MRTNQVSQTIALAVGLVGALGFLGYTMLGPRTAVAVAPLAVEPRLDPRPAAALPQSQPAVLISRPEPIQLTAEQAAFIATGSPQGAHISPSLASTHVDPVKVAEAPVLPVLPFAMPLPPAPVLSVAPPPPSRVRPVATAKPKSVTRESVMRVSKPEPRQPSAVRAAPVTSSVVTTPLASGWEEVKVTPIAAVEKAVAPLVAVQAAPSKKPPASVSISQPFSKDEMTVTISGDKAWVQVSPTQTLTARKGDVLPNLGKILEIKSNQVVAEKGILNTH